MTKDVMMRVSADFKLYLDGVKKTMSTKKRKELTYPKLTKKLVDGLTFRRIRL